MGSQEQYNFPCAVLYHVVFNETNNPELTRLKLSISIRRMFRENEVVYVSSNFSLTYYF